jgi:tryptophanyl-tRNA synthetase
MRATYDELMAHPEKVEAFLQGRRRESAGRGHAVHRPLRHAVGLRPLQAAAQPQASKADKAALPTFKQYREKDGLFYFKLADAKGRVLLQSVGTASPKEAGQAIAQLKSQGYAASAGLHAVAPVAEGVKPEEVEAALQAMRDAE